MNTFRAGHEINKAESKKLRSENLCVFCGEDTAFGSGRFVNRIPADTYHELDDGTEEYRDGYACAECMASECGRCDEEIPLDEDYSVDNGHTRLHWHCLTDQEKAICDRDVYDWERLTDKEKEADSNSD